MKNFEKLDKLNKKVFTVYLFLSTFFVLGVLGWFELYLICKASKSQKHNDFSVLLKNILFSDPIGWILLYTIIGLILCSMSLFFVRKSYKKNNSKKRDIVWIIPCLLAGVWGLPAIIILVLNFIFIIQEQKLNKMET